MIKTKVLLAKLAKRFPKRIAIKYHDHVGLMAGSLPESIQKIVLCLDFDDEVFELIKNDKPDLIISHHPFIFGTKNYVLKHDPVKRVLYDKVMALGVPVYSMHTNFDEGKGGMNDALASALELKDIKPLDGDPMARGGNLTSPMDVKDFAKFAKRKFNISYGLLISEGKQTIESVAVVGGGGSYGFRVARLEGYDIYISGDAPHHIRREVIANNYNYLDLPHEIEKIFMPTMKKILQSFDDTLDVQIIDHEKEPAVI